MICFVWSGFPQYAARCVGAFVRTVKEECAVVATRPKVPVVGMERLCGCPVHWIEENDRPDFRELFGRVPDRIVVDGWGFPAFNMLRDQVLLSKGRVYCMVDNNFNFSFREVAKAVRFRLLLRKYYSGYLVPGLSGVRLLRFYGVPKGLIRRGMYAADGELFYDKRPILSRAKKMIFVGQLCDRKNIVPFAEEFSAVAEDLRKDWVLEICGCGPLKGDLPDDPAIVIHDFVQPEQLAELYQNARVFVLPSKEEHWGLVVHEAALSGCVLLVSKQVGANDDFVTLQNGCVFDAYSRISMRKAIEHILRMSDEQQEVAERQSVLLARNASIEKFVEGVSELLSL